MAYQWNFWAVFLDLGVLAQGLVNTLKVTALALLFGLPLGGTLALARLSRHRAVSIGATVIVEVFRTTPPLIQLYWFFFALPLLINVAMTPFIAAVVSLSIQSSAFFAEVLRAGIVSIESGQWDAGRAIGMRPRQVMERIVLPQAVKRMVPALLERSIELLKTTTLVSAISYSDLLFQANELAQKTFRPLEVFTVTALLYFAIIYPVSVLTRLLERRLAASGESTAG